MHKTVNYSLMKQHFFGTFFDVIVVNIHKSFSTKLNAGIVPIIIFHN